MIYPKFENLSSVLEEKDLKLLLEMSDKRIPEWRELSLRMSIEQHLQLDKYKRSRDRRIRLEREENMTKEEMDINKIYILNWAATRWNEGNYNLDFEYEEMEKYRKSKIGQISNLRKNRVAFMTQDEQFSFFSSRNSPFSLFYKSIFEDKGDQFHSVVQYMMRAKAKLFLNKELEQKIMQTDEPEMAFRLGRCVKNFNKFTWKNMYFGNSLRFANIQKFKQSEELKKILFDTQGKTLVLSCKSDAYWGIGLSVNDKRSKFRNQWIGKNILGELLTDIRVELMERY